ncbi:MAG TPA: hypothetical protein PLX20_12235 [Rhodocyclaceae bacterium]|nr:hypothetical protein [Rhodocyclaceae bacterium]HMV53672.1 hypothetical protein [Rhodocyclaceae bacterium]HNA03803.1 hypothetical protein [Rhodocyclaceae bacterium]HNH13901.1 hypothetical protein [Rhodocyclaceae bacterium]HNH99479.1 hypothetical protein [Rhodocyclaceae bacterium]
MPSAARTPDRSPETPESSICAQLPPKDNDLRHFSIRKAFPSNAVTGIGDHGTSSDHDRDIAHDRGDEKQDSRLSLLTGKMLKDNLSHGK